LPPWPGPAWWGCGPRAQPPPWAPVRRCWRRATGSRSKRVAWAIPPGPAPGLATVEAVGFDRLLAEHRAAWATRWADAELTIEGDPDAELAVRFALFHLLGSATGEGESAVGARGLTGPVYAGHVFWDADVFVLPVLAAVHPAAARAMLEYRIRRLGPARSWPPPGGGPGARFAWESAADGTEVAPQSWTAAAGRCCWTPPATGHPELAWTRWAGPTSTA
jgi:trehalose/maltose hydrolase-like predicted phosphorylase